MNPSKSERYRDRRFLRLLECYVLRAIGALSAEQARALELMTPKLRQVYRTDGEWFEIIEHVMDFPSDLPRKIVAVWEKNKQLAAQNGTQLEADSFAVMFVDANFPVSTRA